MPSHCPACGRAVPEDAEACPFCPMSWREEETGHQARRRRKGALNPSRWPVAVWILLTGVLGLGVWRVLSFVLEHGGDVELPKQVANVIDQRTQIPTGEDGAAAKSKGTQALSTTPPEEEAGPEPETQYVSAIVKQRAPVKEWRLRGQVYDLVTLKPVARCALVLSDAQTNARFETSTDGQGRYRIIVPPLEERGYSVKITHDGYASSYLNPGMENVPQLSADERKQLAVELAHSLDGIYTVQAASSQPLVTDFYIAPLAP